MPADSSEYVSYLLRLWKSNDGSSVVYRAALVQTISGERHVFATLDALCAFLRSLNEGSSSATKAENRNSSANKP